MGHIKPESFKHVANEIWGVDRTQRHSRIFESRFKGFFNYSAEQCAIAWNKMEEQDLLPYYVLPMHILWTLMWLKLYMIEEVMCSMLKVRDKTFRKY